MSSQSLRAAVVLLFVFTLGGLTGVFIDRHRMAPAPVELSAEAVHNEAMSELRAVLNLDDDQMAQIHAVLTRHQEDVQRAWEALRPEVSSAMQNVHVEIADLLRPAQRGLYHEWLAQRQQESRAETTNVLPGH